MLPTNDSVNAHTHRQLGGFSGGFLRSVFWALVLVVTLLGTGCHSPAEVDSDGVVVDSDGVVVDSDEEVFIDDAGSSPSDVGEDWSEDVHGWESTYARGPVCLSSIGGGGGEGWGGERAGVGGQIAFTRHERQDAYVVSAEGGPLRSLGTGGSVPLWSPDGSSVAFVSGGGVASNALFVADSTDGDLLHKTRDYAGLYKAAWSPDGSRLAFTVREADGQRGLLVMTLNSKRVDEVFAFVSPRIYGDRFAWSPDGTGMAVLGEKAVWLVNVDGPDVGKVIFSTQIADARELLWSPDGSWLAVLAGDKDYVVDAATGRKHLLLSDPSSRHLNARDVRWSPDGSRVAFWAYDNGSSIFVVDATGENLERLIRFSDDIRQVEWSPDGTQIALLRWTDLAYGDVYVMTSDGGNVRNLTEDLRGVVGQSALQWSPDGSRIVINGTVKFSPEVIVINVNSGSITQLTDNNDQERHLQWSPDGEQVSFVIHPVPEVFVMDADGSDQRRLTGEVRSKRPLWAPTGTLISFENDAFFDELVYEPGLVPSHLSRPLSPSPNQILVAHSSRSYRRLLTGEVGGQHSLRSPTGASVSFNDEGHIQMGRETGTVRGHLLWLSIPSPNQIFVVRSDGTELLRIPETYAYHPAWSPDGSRIAFTSHTGSQDSGVFVAEVDGSTPRLLTKGTDPAWSPHGNRIAFVIPPIFDGGWEPQGKAAIHLINADRSQPEQLTDNTEDQGFPAWSPDGSHIAYVSGLGYQQDRDNNQWDIYLTHVGSGETRQLTDRKFSSVEKIVWSPDGFHLAFKGDDGNQSGVFMLDVDNANLRLYADMVSNPSWSPDGSRMVFASNRDGDDEVFVMDSDGRNLQQLTNNDHKDSDPVWSPAGEPNQQ